MHNSILSPTYSLLLAIEYSLGLIFGIYSIKYSNDGTEAGNFLNKSAYV